MLDCECITFMLCCFLTTSKALLLVSKSQFQLQMFDIKLLCMYHGLLPQNKSKDPPSELYELE